MLLQAEAILQARAAAKSSPAKIKVPQQAADTSNFLLTPLKTKDAAQMGISAQPERKIHSPNKAGSSGRGRKQKAAFSSIEADARGQSRPGRGRYLIQPILHLPYLQILGILTSSICFMDPANAQRSAQPHCISNPTAA